MRIRYKHIASLFLLTAGLLFIAHAVVPHHHHNHLICIENLGCKDHDSEHSHANGEHDDRHNDSGSGNCIYYQYIVLPGNQTKNECDCSFITSLHTHSYAYILSDDLNSRNHPVYWKAKFAPSTLLHDSFLKSSSLGRRAPPAA